MNSLVLYMLCLYGRRYTSCDVAYTVILFILKSMRGEGEQILAHLFCGRPSARLCQNTVDNDSKDNSFICWAMTQLLGNSNSYFSPLNNQRCGQHHCSICGSSRAENLQWCCCGLLRGTSSPNFWTLFLSQTHWPFYEAHSLSVQRLSTGCFSGPKPFWCSQHRRFVPPKIRLLEVLNSILLDVLCLLWLIWTRYNINTIQSLPLSWWNGSHDHVVQHIHLPHACCT